MSWNIENFPRTAKSVDAVARVLNEFRPDLVAVQEIADEKAFQALDDELPDYEGILNDDPGAMQRIGVLIRSDRVTVDGVETLFQGDWYAFPRPPLRVQATFHGTLGTSFDFSLVSVHLKAMSDEDSAYRRRLACEKLDSWLQQELLSPRAEHDIVIAGDWNDQITDPVETNVFAPLLDRPEEYRFLTAELEGTGAFSYISYRSLIDHVMVTSGAAAQYGAGAINVLPLDEVDPYYQLDLSDHRPLLSRFQMPADL